MRTLADHLKQQGLALSGFVQVNQSRAGRTRCDMILEELSSGKRIAISEDRGAEARGCMLDMSELLRASTLAASSTCTPTESLDDQ